MAPPYDVIINHQTRFRNPRSRVVESGPADFQPSITSCRAVSYRCFLALPALPSEHTTYLTIRRSSASHSPKNSPSHNRPEHQSTCVASAVAHDTEHKPCATRKGPVNLKVCSGVTRNPNYLQSQYAYEYCFSQLCSAC